MLRLRLVRRAGAALVLAMVVGTLVVVPATPASAQDCEAPPGCTCGAVETDGGVEFHPFCVDGGEGGGRVCERTGLSGPTPVPCSTDLGWWSNERQCYLSLLNPQPPASDPVWDGHSPDEGRIYIHSCPFLEGVDTLSFGEEGLRGDQFVPLGEDPLWSLVEQAIGMLELGSADIQMAPDPAGAGLVYLPVWMWTPVTEQTWDPEPVVLELESFGVTLEAWASVETIWWDMGDGSDPVPCDTPGTPYDPEYGIQESPDCGHVYTSPSREQPEGRYPVTATTDWLVEWEFSGVAGMGGSLEFEAPPSSTSVQINELQVLSGG